MQNPLLLILTLLISMLAFLPTPSQAQNDLPNLEQYRVRYYFSDPYARLSDKKITEVVDADTTRRKPKVTFDAPAEYESLQSYLKEDIDSIAVGYRVQIFMGREKGADEAKLDFSEEFEDYGVYEAYESPFFKVRVGDFRLRSAAERFAEKVRERYPAAFVVPSEIRPDFDRNR